MKDVRAMLKVGDRVIYRETNKLATVTRVVRLPEFSDPNYIEVRFDDGWVCTYRAAQFTRTET